MSISESLALKIPNRLKPPLRILLGCIQLLKKNHIHIKIHIKEFRIKLSQQILLRKNYSHDTETLILFLTPGYDRVSGGILSISSIYAETIKLKHIHGAEVIMCTIPGYPPLLRYSKFNNQNYIYMFSQVLAYFQNLRNLMIHIPEYRVDQFQRDISNEDYLRLRRINSVHMNIMLQNIKLLSPMKYIEELRKIGKLTCTTAHEQYSTAELRERLGIPLHKISTWVSPEQYNRKRFTDKENLMVVSRDAHPLKAEVLELIAKQFPQLRIQIIWNLTYEEYKDVISQAKWALTFGEGLDGYFIETVFTGGISFSVYNTLFFTKDFGSLRTIYDDYNVLLEKMCSDLADLDNEDAYTVYQNKQYNLCCKYYNYKEYINNLRKFYKGEYTFP